MTGAEITLPLPALDRLWPMSVLLEGGTVAHAGPLAQRLLGLGSGQALALPDPLPAGRFRLALPLAEVTALALPVGQGVLLAMSLGDDVARIAALDLGAEDFGTLDVTPAFLSAFRAAQALTEQLRRANQQLQGAKTMAEEEAMTDILTGLRNRRAMDRVLAQMTIAGLPFALMRLDLDFFKAVNDTYGHAAGDTVLRAVARILTQETRDGDILARVGGDEFTLLFPGQPDAAQIAAIGRRIIARLEMPVEDGTNAYRVSASIGATLSSYYAVPDPARMLDEADQALYAAKRGGRAQVRLARD